MTAPVIPLIVHVVTPVTGLAPPEAAGLAARLGPGVTVTCSRIAAGPASIECELDEALAVPGTLAEVRSAAESGADAIVIDCMGDPVLGPGQTAMHVAAMLGHRFSILTVLDRLVHLQEARAGRYGLRERLASVRSVGVPVLALHEDPDRVVAALTEEGLRAVRDDGAHVLILGCMGMLGTAERVSDGLAARGLAGVPVIDPLPVTLAVAAVLARGGLAHSRRTYPDPPAKARTEWASSPAPARAGRPG